MGKNISLLHEQLINRGRHLYEIKTINNIRGKNFRLGT